MAHEVYTPLSTGIPALDKLLQNIMPGDNIVWQIDSLDEYVPFVRPFAEDACNKGGLIYFYFGLHKKLLDESPGVTIHTIDPHIGFESATSAIHKIMDKAGRGSYFLFDCLSDLAAIWYSDLMMGNFYNLTCPYVYDMDSVAYFAMIRNRHSLPVAASIRDTAQILLDVYRHDGSLYVHPMKVWQRHSPTMYMPHIWDKGTFRPVTDSASVSEVVSAVMGLGMDSSSRVVDIWDRTFMQAEEVLEKVNRGERPKEDADEYFQKLLKMVFSREERVLAMASKYLTLVDILNIRKRLVGTGLIGGKSVGMVIARAILTKAEDRWRQILEVHDSFYIGSDVFYTYIVANGCWRMRQKQRDPSTFLDGIEEARQSMLTGNFPEFIQNQFVDMLDYFGQSPIIVRSSSLLEDNFGNAFSGKYESVFCVNQGTRSERLKAFLTAVRRVYSSTMSMEALVYRAHRGLLDRDEQMAILVQRVSGVVCSNLYFPQIAGVGLSFNPYVWSERIRSDAGMLRLVCGLGTRAVDRHDDDYTRLVALNAPELRHENNFDEVVEYAQRKMDVLDLNENKLLSKDFGEIVHKCSDYPFDIVASQIQKEWIPGMNESSGRWVITFEKLLSKTPFVEYMLSMLKTLEKTYGCPVDVEFTVNFRKSGKLQINLVQCRPLQIGGEGKIVAPPEHIADENIIFDAHGTIIGRSIATTIDRIIYVVPAVYGQMPESERYSVARMIGRLTHRKNESSKIIMLMGPGRWGTSMPALGVPAKFAEINTVSVICEIVEMNENLIPDVSLGTHFFNDIVEFKMLYLAISPRREENILNKEFLESSPNKLLEFFPGEAKWANAIRVIDSSDIPNGRKIYLNANTINQRAVSYLTTDVG
jgi:pyruvate, water dikinase